MDEVDGDEWPAQSRGSLFKLLPGFASGGVAAPRPSGADFGGYNGQELFDRCGGSSRTSFGWLVRVGSGRFGRLEPALITRLGTQATAQDGCQLLATRGMVWRLV